MRFSFGEVSKWYSICEFSKPSKLNPTLIFGNAEVYREGQRLVANVSFAGTMWEHKGRLETQYCACAQAHDVSNGLYQKISEHFLRRSLELSKAYACKIDGESISQAEMKLREEREHLTCLTFSILIYRGESPGYFIYDIPEKICRGPLIYLFQT